MKKNKICAISNINQTIDCKKKYLRIISKQKNSFFYFLKREIKTLPGGEKNCKIICNKQASFSNVFYNTKFPFIHYQTKSKRHALVKLT